MSHQASTVPAPENDPVDPRPWPSSALSLVAVVAGLAGLILLGSILLSSSFAEAGFGHRQRWSGHGGPADPEAAREHAEHAADWVLRYVDASDEQRAQVSAIIARSVDDLFGLANTHREHRDAMLELFRSPEIDRVELDRLRRAELELADGASQTLLDALVEAAEVLTPEQRAELMELGERFHH
jgi:Spy/CpxP family protein refolding chaperone